MSTPRLLVVTKSPCVISSEGTGRKLDTIILLIDEEKSRLLFTGSLEISRDLERKVNEMKGEAGVTTVERLSPTNTDPC